MGDFKSRKIGKYQIQAELGRGGFGSVYRAYDPTVGRLVAIKVLTASGDQQLLTRFKNEAGAAGNLRHKNIITIYDFGDHEGLPYIVMEFLEGEDLQQVISQNRPLTLLQKVSIMLQVADGLNCAHRSGVVHRDVKPGNIRLLPDGTVKIMDFGIARLVAGGSGARLTRQGHVIGTLLYMAPEQVRGGEVDFLCDIFAYGITYYELLTGKHPFQGSDPRTVFYRITMEDPEPIRNIIPECPEALEIIVNHTLHKERELRYQSLREVQLDTEPLLIELRQERATSLVVEANRLYSGGQLDSAQAVLSEAFDLDPGNRGARQLRETIQNQLLRRVIELKIEALLKKGETAIAERQFQDAIESFDAALRLDRDNSEIKDRLNRARELLNMSRESSRMVTEARREFSRNNLEGAFQILPETLEIDPGNPDARQLLQEVRQELARREKERECEKKMQQARELLQDSHFDDALRQLDALNPDDKGRDDVRKLTAETKARKQAHERQQKFNEELAFARELLTGAQFEPAIRHLERLMNKYPEEAEATKLFIVAHKKLAIQRKGEALENLGIELGQLLEGRQFERALELVNEALRDYPDEQRLLDAIGNIEAEQEEYRKSEVVREAVEAALGCVAQGAPEAAVQLLEAVIAQYPGEERLARALSDARLLVEKKRRDEAIESLCRDADWQLEHSEFDRALAAVDNGIGAYGQEPRLAGAREKIVHAKARWERSETIRRALQDSEQRLLRNEPEQAVQALEAALGRYPGEEQLAAALSLARQALQAKQREEAIAALIREADSQLTNQDFQSALAGIEQGLEAFGHDNRLTALRESILHAKAEWERNQAVRAALEDSRQRLTRNEPEDAVAVLEAALQQYPGEEQLTTAFFQAREAVETKLREAGIEEVCREAGSRLESLAFDQALAGMEQGFETFGNDQRLARLREKILAARSDWERAEAVRQAIENARQHIANDDLESAIHVLEAALQQYPREEELTNAASQARGLLEAKRREEAIQAACREAGSHLENGRFEQALAIIGQAVQVYGQDERLTGLRDQIDRAKADWERSEHVRNAIQDSGERLANGEPESAVVLLEAALRRYPDDERLLQAVAGARQALDALRRETAIQELCREATARLERLAFDPALDSIEQGLKSFGEDPRLIELREKIASTRTEWHRAELVRRAIEQSRHRLAKDDPEGAVQILEAAITRYPGEPRLENAIAAARETLEAKRREGAIESLCREAGAQLERQEFDRALAGIEQGIRTHNDDVRLTRLRDEVLAASAAWEREQTVGRALEDSGQHLSLDNPQSAVRVLEAALSRYPDDNRLIEAASAARQALDVQRRNTAIVAICQAVAAKTEVREFHGALEEIARGIAAYGADERLVSLQEKTAAAKAKARWERSETIRQALQDSEQRLLRNEPEQAVQALEAALGRYPGEEQLAAALSLARQALQAKQREEAIAALIREADSQLTNQDFQSALAGIEQGLEAFGHDNRLTALRESILHAKAEWERNQAVRAALEDSRQRLTRNEPEDAVAVLEAALQQYPGEEQLTTAFFQAREAVETKLREAGIEEVCREAGSRLESLAFDQALAGMEQGFETFGNDQRLARLREKILAARSDWERAEAVRQAIENARQHIANDDLESAIHVLEAALQQYPREEELTNAASQARGLLEAKRREEAIQAACREAGSHLENGRFEQALAIIGQAVQVYGQDERLTGLRDQIDRAKADWERSEHVRNAIQDSGERLANGEPESAVVLLEAALRRYPDDERLLQAVAGARQALDALRRETAIQELCREATARLERLAFDPALDSIEQGLKSFGEDPRLIELREKIASTRTEWHRAELVRRAIEQSRHRLAKDDPEGAVQILEAAITRYPGEPRLENAIAAARETLEAKRREGAIESLCREAGAQLERQEFDRALAGIEQGIRTHNDDVRLTRLRDEVLAASAAWEREQTVGRALEDSGQHLSLDNPQSAVRVLEAALSRYPDDNRLIEAASAARQALDVQRRNTAIVAIRQAVAAKTEVREFHGALEEIARGIAAYGADERLVSLQEKTAAAKADWQRSEFLRTVLQDCAQCLAKGDPDSAVQLLETALKQYPGETQLLAAASAAQQAADAKHRAAAIKKVDRQVRQFLKNRDFPRALAAVEQELRAYPGDPALTQLHQKVAAAAAEWQREQSVRQALSKGAELHGKNRFADALRTLQEVLDQYPDEPRLSTAYREIEADFKRHQREEALRSALEKARRLMAQAASAEAVQLLEAVLVDHPDEPRVIEALNSARKLHEARRREESIEAVCRETRLFMQSGEFVPALDTIERGLQTFGDEKRLAQMRETVVASKADWERAEGVRQVVEEASRYASQGQLETAVESLMSATQVFGPEDRLTEALTATREAIERKRRQDAIKKLCQEVQAELEAQRLDQADQMLDRGEQAHGAAPEFAGLRQHIAAAITDRERAGEVRRTVEDAGGLIDRGAPEQALRLVETALARYPGEPQLLEIRSRALQALEFRRKEEAIETVCAEIRAVLSRQKFKDALKKIDRAQKTHGADRRFEELRTEVASARKARDDRRGPEKDAAPGSPAPARNPWLLRAAAGLLSGAATIGILVFGRFFTATKTVHLQVQASPSNASVRIENQTCTNGDCGFDLKLGVYRIQVSADGYEAKTEQVTLALGGSDPRITIALKPLNPTVQVAANFAQGQVSLDGRTWGHLQDGQFVFDGLQPGKHELRISGSDGAAALSFEIEFAKLPTLGSISADGVAAIALGSFGNQAAVSCSGCSGTVSVDERPAGEIKDGGITIGFLQAGSHQLRLNSESGERNIVFAVGGAPAINLALTSNRNYGTLVVQTGEDGVSVFIDGQRYPQRTVRGQLRMPVEAKEHTVRVAKDGYRVEPAEFRAVVTKGDQLQARFRLTLEPARLLVTDGVPGASVSIDGRIVGTIAADGSFSAQVSPGEHQIAFAREGYTPAETRRDFGAGKAVLLNKVAQLAPVAPRVPPKAPPKAPPVEIPRPDPVAVELADWQRVSRNPTIGDVEEFLQKHPGGNNAQEAQRLLERLEWDAVNKSSRTALQTFLTKHPNGAFAPQVRAELARIDREATAELQKQQEAERIRLDREQIRTVLRSYGEAYVRKDLNQMSALWPSLPARSLRQIRDAFRDFQSLKLELRPLADPEITGTSARVTCSRLVDAVDRNGSHPNQDTVTVRLEYRNSRWLIDSIQ